MYVCMYVCIYIYIYLNHSDTISADPFVPFQKVQKYMKIAVTPLVLTPFVPFRALSRMLAPPLASSI